MEFWFSEFHTPDVKHSIRVSRQLYSKQSDYQRIDIFETPEFGRVLTLDGNVMLTERDEFIYDEMIVHVPMAVHKEARDILVIGAGDGGVVRELTRYDRVERIDLVEMDPQVVEACRAYLPGNACRMDDCRVHIYFENALKFIRRCEEEYDLIIVDSSDPFGPSEGLFTREFYGSCFNALKADGIMVNQQGSPFYAEDASAMQRSHKRIASTFPISRVYQAHIPTFAAGLRAAFLPGMPAGRMRRRAAGQCNNGCADSVPSRHPRPDRQWDDTFCWQTRTASSPPQRWECVPDTPG